MSLSRNILTEWLSDIDIEGKKVLDAGCGPERYHVRNFVKGEPEVYDTLDVDPEFEPTYEIDLNRQVKIPEKYDIIFSIETFEHLYNPVNGAINIHNWLKDDGKFYFSAPFINPIHDKWDMLRLTSEWWNTALMEVGFKNIVVYPREATEGQTDLWKFYDKEGLRMSKIRLKKGEQNKMNHIGYMGKADK